MKHLRVTISFLCIMIILASCAPAGQPAAETPATPAAAAPSAPATAAPAPAAVTPPPPPPAAAEPAAVTRAAQPPPPPPPAAADSAPVHISPQAVAENYFALPIRTPSEAGGRRLIYTVSMRLQTPEFMRGFRKLQDTVGDLGGYLMFMEIWGHDLASPRWERRAHFTFHIPSENIGEFVRVIENNYNIWWARQSTDDATARYQQATTTLEDLRFEESWLLDEIELAETPGQRTSFQRRLSEVRAQIRNFETARAAITYNVVYSTVEIELFEVIIPEDEVIEEEAVIEFTFSERLDEAVSESTGNLLSFIQGLIIFIIVISPVLIILAFCAAIAFPIVRIVKARNQKKGSINQIDDQWSLKEKEDEEKNDE